MSGALIIEGGIDRIPEIAAAGERIFVLQQIPYLHKNCFPDKTQPGGQTCFNFPEGVIEQPDSLHPCSFRRHPGDSQPCHRRSQQGRHEVGP